LARLYEYQGKKLLEQNKIPVPHGRLASSPLEVQYIAKEINKPIVLKAQAWVTGRASRGGINFASTPEEAFKYSEQMFGLEMGGFKVEKLLVEEKLNIDKEYYSGIIIDDKNHCPVIIFSSIGGTGVEEIAQKYPNKIAHLQIDIIKGLKDYQVRNMVRRTGISGKLQMKIAGILLKLYQVARKYEARAAEINPLVTTKEGELIAADCRITIDDYAVFRHPELEIEIAREFNRPATALDKIAYKVEEGDYRGTFYFIQLAQNFNKGDRYIGFHGAGGGGSMMSMDALLREGYKLANFCDTSGNPPASKVYRAAKIILSQKNIIGYFASGSGVASQEQFHSARGMAKAFREETLHIPAIIRLGGNAEEKAIEILHRFCSQLPAPVEGYGRDDKPEYCAKRLKKLLTNFKPKSISEPYSPPSAKHPYSFETLTGKVIIDHDKCKSCKSKICIEVCIPKILKLEDDKAVLAINFEEAKKGGCTECLACELECFDKGNKAINIELPIPGLEDYKKGEI
jgi:succinyl-CoA synthetase beta subunit